MNLYQDCCLARGIVSQSVSVTEVAVEVCTMPKHMHVCLELSHS
jgi:hypothetical protein